MGNWAYLPSGLLTIEPIDNQSYRPSSLLTIKPIDHQAYQPLSLSTIVHNYHRAYWPLSLLTIKPIDHLAYWPSSLSTIKPIDHWAFWPSSLLTIEPINHQAYRPLSPLTIEPIDLWSSYTTFKPFSLLQLIMTFFYISYTFSFANYWIDEYRRTTSQTISTYQQFQPHPLTSNIKLNIYLVYGINWSLSLVYDYQSIYCF